jgi:ABC-type branched-subunit amino acid transport system permease subunit
VSRAEEHVEADLPTTPRFSWWPLLVIGLGGLATAVWALVLGWLALRLFMSLTD